MLKFFAPTFFLESTRQVLTEESEPANPGLYERVGEFAAQNAVCQIDSGNSSWTVDYPSDPEFESRLYTWLSAKNSFFTMEEIRALVANSVPKPQTENPIFGKKNFYRAFSFLVEALWVQIHFEERSTANCARQPKIFWRRPELDDAPPIVNS